MPEPTLRDKVKNGIGKKRKVERTDYITTRGRGGTGLPLEY